MRIFTLVIIFLASAHILPASDAELLEFNQSLMPWTDTVNMLKASIVNEDYKTAYELMSTGFRRQVTLDQFTAALHSKRISSITALPLNSTQFSENFAMTIYRFRYKTGGHGYEQDEVWFLKKEQDEWKFENLPITTAFGIGGIPDENNLQYGLYLKN